MPQPRYLLAALLLLTVTFAPLSGWPNGQMSAYAQSVRDGSKSAGTNWSWWNPFAALTVSASNENEQKDRENRQKEGNNDNGGGGNDNSDSNSNSNSNGNNNNNNDDGGPPPPPPPSNRSQSAPSGQASGCLQNGGTVSLTLPGGLATFKAYQDNLAVDLTQVDPSSVPPPPGSLIGQLVFRLGASQCGGSGMASLPGEDNLGVGYSEDAAAGHDKSKLSLMFWDGSKWSPAPKQANDQGAKYVSATISALGTYALVQP